MKNTSDTFEPITNTSLYGKVMGILQNQSRLDTFAEELGKSRTGNVTALRGVQGTEQLERWKEALEQYFFGDMEMKMLQRYLNAIGMNLIVVVIDVESDQAEMTAQIAKSNGAVDVVYFGNSVVTNY